MTTVRRIAGGRHYTVARYHRTGPIISQIPDGIIIIRQSSNGDGEIGLSIRHRALVPLLEPKNGSHPASRRNAQL